MRRHPYALLLIVALCAMLSGGGMSNGIVTSREEATPFNAFLGYGQLLSVTEGLEDGARCDGFVDVAGSSIMADVIIIVAHEGGAQSRTVKMEVDVDGDFAGRVWLVDGPGLYTLSVACRSQGATKYAIVCEAVVRNVAEGLPLVPLEYVGYGEDLVIYGPRGGSSKIAGGLRVDGWSRYATVRAVVESSSGPILEYFTEAGPDGSFVFDIPLPAWMGKCEIKLCSKKIGPNSWRGVAAYRIEAVAAAIHTDQPAYQAGLILATGPFALRGGSEFVAPMQVEILDRQGRVIGIPESLGVVNSEWSTTITPPEGLLQFSVRITGTDSGASEHAITYSVAMVDFQGSPKPTEQTMDASVRSVAASIGASVPDGPGRDYALLKSVHDWVALSTRYDVKGANSGRPGPGDAATTLARGEGVCLGYANLTAAILDCLGIENRVVVGRADNGTLILRHAWNEAVVDGRVVFMDVTWDSGTIDGLEFEPGLKWQYFDPAPEQVAFSHFADVSKR